MYIKSACLSDTKLEDAILKNDKKNCRKFGPCGVGKLAIYVNSFYLDRIYYIPFSGITRIYKRIAMSKGGFTGRGVFASIPYLIVEYDNGKEKKCNFKDERQVDALLDCLAKEQPQIKLLSKRGEAQLAERAAKLAARNAMDPTEEEAKLIRNLQTNIDYLNRCPELARDLSYWAKRKRNYQNTSPSYRWVAMAITLLGSASLLYGVWALIHSNAFAIYFTLFGLAAIFLFAGFSVLPTARNNRASIYRHYDQALEAMEEYVKKIAHFPLPARYAHPIVLLRMQRAIGNHHAATTEEALEVIKKDLRALTADVQVEQEEYDEVVAIKPLFTVADYL